MSKSRFNKKTAQKFAVVHRPHDDPLYYNDDVSQHILVPMEMPNQPKKERIALESTHNQSSKNFNEHVGEAVLYGIKFDDSSYDYTQHLKPIGQDPSNSIFIPSKTATSNVKGKRENIEDLFVEAEYKDNSKQPQSLFTRGIAKPEYLEQMQDIPDELRGFKPDMNPDLREVLEALEDDAYVVNDNIVVSDARKSLTDEVDSEEDDFAELLGSGKVEDEDEFHDNFDEWDVDDLGNYEEQYYRHEMAQFDNIETLQDLQDIDIGADVRRFKQQMKQDARGEDYDDVGSSMFGGSVNSEQEELDGLGDLPTFKNPKKSTKKSKERRRKGAMSDTSGFSMTSSVLARTEVMTVLDDKYDQIIGGYENYEEEQDLEEEKYEPFDMSRERADFENLLDDFLDNYELEKGGRALTKKDEEVHRLKVAADEVSKGKLSVKRNKERAKQRGVNSITSGIQSLKF